MTLNLQPRDTYVVVGLARSGQAAASRLLAHRCVVRVTDIKPEGDLAEPIRALQNQTIPEGGRLEFFLGGHPDSILDGARALILSPGVPVASPFIQKALARDIPVWSEVEFAFRLLRGVLVGITGSNGKSTTTALTAHILRQAGRDAYAVGNIGAPLSDYLVYDSPATIYVTELSSFQLETIDTFRPRIAAILNLTPDHLDRYESFEEYAAAKWNIFRNMGPGDRAILNGQDPMLTRDRGRITCPILEFRSAPQASPESIRGAGVVGDTVYVNSGGESLAILGVPEIPLPGRHNLENALVAALAAHLLGLAPAEIRSGILGFRALAHRLQPVAEVKGRRYYNDSKATNVDSTLLAIESFPHPIVLILGGKDKGSDYAPLVEPIRRRVRQVLLIGAASDKIDQALPADIPRRRVRDMADAVRTGLEVSEPGDAVVLSPACASFDMFDNFEHRGEVFCELVRQLKRDVEP
jgi:UDP-N-acetylmuramoylalanine--D-glutamate ligase